MKTRIKLFQIATLCLFITTLTSCKQARLKQDSTIAAEILSEIGGAENAQLWYTNVGELSFVQLDVSSSSMLEKSNNTEVATASYLATQLYKRLNPHTISSNGAIQILFDGEDDGYSSNSRPGFYEYSELDNAWNAFNHIEGFVKSGLNKDLKTVLTHLDTSFSQESAIDLIQKVSEVIKHPILGYQHFYEGFTIKNGKEQDSINCLNVFTIIRLEDNSSVPMRFLVHKEKLGNRIIRTDI